MANLFRGWILAYPNFEQLEAEGQRLLPERVKARLKGLAQGRPKPGRSALGEGNAEDWVALITGGATLPSFSETKHNTKDS